MGTPMCICDPMLGIVCATHRQMQQDVLRVPVSSMSFSQLGDGAGWRARAERAEAALAEMTQSRTKVMGALARAQGGRAAAEAALARVRRACAARQAGDCTYIRINDVLAALDVQLPAEGGKELDEKPVIRRLPRGTRAAGLEPMQGLPEPAYFCIRESDAPPVPSGTGEQPRRCPSKITDGVAVRQCVGRAEPFEHLHSAGGRTWLSGDENELIETSSAGEQPQEEA